MKFVLNHSRAITGNNVSVHIEADEGKSIQRVRTELDGFELADDQLSAPSDSYDRAFPTAGTAGSGTQHKLVVSAQQDDNKSHNSTSIWVDTI